MREAPCAGTAGLAGLPLFLLKNEKATIQYTPIAIARARRLNLAGSAMKKSCTTDQQGAKAACVARGSFDQPEGAARRRQKALRLP